MEASARSPRSLRAMVVMLTACALACAGFVALGVWQVHRLAWKEALVARVERNVHGTPVPAPGLAQWPQLTSEDAYRRVQLRGSYDFAHEIPVAASTELGAGYWVLTPLRTEEGAWVFVNRGFVPPELRGHAPPAAPEQAAVGLLRSTEPGGRPLQANDPAAGRWYSRDVQAMAKAQGLQGPVAPYFVDLVATPENKAAWPRAGLTVLQFPNNHLVYALTWFALAAMMAAAFVYVLLDARRARRMADS
jgi:surfeit locus 1 family protein